MELLETNDPKNLLVRKSEKHKKELENEMKLISDNTEKIITNALVIGGTLAVSYIIARQFFKSKSKGKSKPKKIKLVKQDEEKTETVLPEDNSEPGIVSQIGSALAAHATVFLLDLAKDKLSSYVTTHFKKESESTNERS